MSNERTCPSGRCREGAQLVGFVGPEERLVYVRPAMAIDAEFVANAEAGGDPERRFRFAEPCQEHGCAQWTGESCGVIERLIEAPPAEVAADELPRCGIRRSCRWFAQAGAAACRICPFVLTDNRPLLVPMAVDLGI